MSNFPLYDDLLKKVREDELTIKEKDEFMKNVLDYICIIERF